MTRIAVLVFALTCALTAKAENTFRVEYKLYRTTVPDEEQAAKETIRRSSPGVGIIEGDSIDASADFSMEDDQLVYQPADYNELRRYELISSPSLVVKEDEAAILKIGEQVPYQDAGEDEDGNPIMLVKHKDVGTTVNATVSESGDNEVTVQTNGEFVTLAEMRRTTVADTTGNESVLPIFEKTTWESEVALPLGAWSYQRVKVARGHEFLVFARVTRFDTEAEAKQEQYSVEMKLMSVPESVANSVRAQFVYDESAKSKGDQARVFRVTLPGTKDTAVDREFLSILNTDGVELLTAPRITVGGGNSLFKLTIFNNSSSGVVQGTAPNNTAFNGVEQFMKFSPVAAEFLRKKGPNLGVISDATYYMNPVDGLIQGFDGFQFGVQIDPPANASDETFGLNFVFHHQFKTGGREKTLFRKAEPYTFGDQVFSFSGLPVHDNEKFGIDFTSKKTGEPMFLLVNVDTIHPSGAQTFEAVVTAPPSPSNGKSPDLTESFPSIAIPDNVEVVLNIVPRIDGQNVRLHTELFLLQGAPARSMQWADIVVPNREAAVIGYDIDGAEMRARLLGIGSKSGAGVPVSRVGTANVFLGVAVPDDVDYVGGIMPQIEGGGIRVWLNFARKEDLGKPAIDTNVWTNVIVNAGDSLTLGYTSDGSVELLGVRRAASLSAKSD